MGPNHSETMQYPEKKNYYHPVEVRRPNKRWSTPMGFNKVVIEHLAEHNVKCGSSYVSMVRRGVRTNDHVLLAIIKVDHDWEKLERERFKKLL